jgi:glycosyltransferase involved in cell wall biosynthesis
VHVALDARFLAHEALRGSDRYTVGLAQALAKQGVRVTLVHEERALPREEHFYGGLGSLSLLGVAGQQGVRWEQVALPLALAKQKVDVYHAPAERGVPLAAGCPIVLALHSATVESYADLIARGLLSGEVGDYILDETGKSFLARQYLGAELRWADRIVTPSDYARDEIVRLLGVPSSLIATTHLCVDRLFEDAPVVGATETLTRLGIRKPYLLYVGGYERHKNAQAVLTMYRRMLATHPRLSLVLVGTGLVPSDIRQAAAALSAVCLSNVNQDLVVLYDEAEVFVSMSWRETFGLPALEAMSRGTPVVVSSWGAAREVVGEAGYLIDPRDVDGAATAVTRAIENRKTLSAQARLQARKFSWTVTANKTIEVYEAALCDSRRVARRFERWGLSLWRERA